MARRQKNQFVPLHEIEVGKVYEQGQLPSSKEEWKSLLGPKPKNAQFSSPVLTHRDGGRIEVNVLPRWF